MKSLLLLAAGFLPAWVQQPSEGIRLQTFRGDRAYAAGTGRIIAVQTAADLARVKVEFSESGSWSLLDDEIQVVNGGFLWKLPRRSIPKCRLRVSYKDSQGREFSDQSEKDFTIAFSAPQPLQLAVALPGTVKGGTKADLKWISQDGGSKVTVSVVVDGKAEIIARDQPGTGGVAAWIVPKIDAKGCRIILEAGDRSWKSPPFEIDSSAPEIEGVDNEISGK
jgi:hypothetical protein